MSSKSLQQIQKRKRRKHQADESRVLDANLEGAPKFRVETFLIIIDKILVSLAQHRCAKQISQDFSFIQSLHENAPIKLKLDVSTLSAKYTGDLESFLVETIHLGSLDSLGRNYSLG